uniref:Probable ATP-dependent RNA helicase DDX46 n=1 Tax=Romanomermis culicivorax TaxID=13658 RepID=A0A915K4N1_ROMCU
MRRIDRRRRSRSRSRSPQRQRGDSGYGPPASSSSSRHYGSSSAGYGRAQRSRSRSPRRSSRRNEVNGRNGGGAAASASSRGLSTSSSQGKLSSSAVAEKNAHLAEIFDMDNKELAEKKLEEEMRKRKEKIEKWRAERAAQSGEQSSSGGVEEGEKAPKKKLWTLEEDEDDDEEATDAKAEQKAAEEDPLDAYMEGVNREVRTLLNKKRSSSSVVTKSVDTKKTEETSEAKTEDSEAPKKPKAKIVMVTRVANQPMSAPIGASSQQMGQEVLEQNADAMEYSDEEKDTDLAQAISSLAAKAKTLPATDHAKIYYRPFRKNFYIETSEIARMTPEEVDAYRLELEGIRVRGKNCPKPIKNWAQTGCSRQVLDSLKKFQYEKPTPIQAQAIPAVLSGRDVIGIAKTGSGKTLAFLIPMFRHVLDQPPLEDMDGPIAVVMTPTRELAMQIAKECRKFCRPLNLRCVCVYGGTGISEQIAELKRGAEIIVCTPGRMIDMLAANNGKVTNLRRITYLVLDEADRMFDMGFEPQVMKIVSNIRPDRQTVMFSATFPRQMEALARKVLIKPIEIQVGSRSVVCKDVEQNVLIVPEEEKFLKLLELLGHYYESGNVLVFVDKQERADDLISDLMKNGYYLCAPLHGGIDQFDRDSTIMDFKSGKIKVLTATSVAARGLDVKNLILVVNYDCPNHYEDYVHRVGRTGRAGNKGFAYTFLLPEAQERQAGDLIRALEQADDPVPEPLREMWQKFADKMESQGKKIKKGGHGHGGGGFGGRGFKFDEAEAERVASKRKLEKLVMGLAHSDNEDEDDIDQQIQSLMKSTFRVTENVTTPIANGAATQANAAAPTPANESALEKAKLAAQLIHKNMNIGGKDVTQQTAEAVLKGQPTSINLSSKTIAQQMAEKLNERLNYVPVVEQAVEEQQPYTRYEEELEINDFPQQVRWRVTSRETIQNIQDYAECGISVKGSFIPTGKEPKENERRLFLAIEATSDLSINRAKTEIIRILKEELIKLAQQNAQQGHNKARYKVV